MFQFLPYNVAFPFFMRNVLYQRIHKSETKSHVSLARADNIDPQTRVQTINTVLALLEDGGSNAQKLLIYFIVAYN